MEFRPRAQDSSKETKANFSSSELVVPRDVGNKAIVTGKKGLL
jgi:hypothetical protein